MFVCAFVCFSLLRIWNLACFVKIHKAVPFQPIFFHRVEDKENMLGLCIWGKLTLGCWLRYCRRNAVSIPFHSSIENADGSKNIKEESMTKQGWNERINCPFLLSGKMTLQFIVASNLLTKYREIIRQFKQELAYSLFIQELETSLECGRSLLKNLPAK